MSDELIRGDSRTIKVTFKDSAGDLYDLTGATAYLTISKSANPSSDENAVIQKTQTNLTGEGVVTFKLTPNDTEISPGNYWFDAQLVDAEENKLSRKRDKITVIPDITRS
jgi:predicted aspartyl protease